MRVTVVVAGIAVVLAACQTPYQGNEESPYYVVPAGSRLILNKELSFNPDQVSVYVQNGKVMRLNELQKYDPFCKFELYRLVHTPRTIAPGEIDVTRAMQGHYFYLFSQTARPYYTAMSLPHVVLGGSFEQGGTPLESFVVRMDLHSEKQPEVYRMTCIRWSTNPSRYEYPSIVEMRQTLKPLFTLRTPAQG